MKPQLGWVFKCKVGTMRGRAITVLNAAALFHPGQEIVISGLTPRLPQWVMRKPWQDGDQAIVRWFYKLVGWKLPTSYKAKITGIEGTTLRLK